jgi:hypothetical protein
MSTNDPNQTNEYVPPPPSTGLRTDWQQRQDGTWWARDSRGNVWEYSADTKGPVLPPQPQATNGLAVAALVLGILWLFWLGSTLAILFGHIALDQIKHNNQSGKGMAVAGLVLGYVGAGTFALFVVLPLLLGAGA